MKKRKNLSPEEKQLKALHALFILNAAQLQMGAHDMRKILGVAMKDITSIKKAVNKALKKYGKGAQKRSSSASR